MRKETTETSIKIVEHNQEQGEWYVRWDFKPKPDEEGVYWYEEETYTWIPTIEDVQQTITDWCNKQTDGIIKYGFEWEGIKVYLSDENKFNYKAITDEATRRETAIAIWDKEHPELAGKIYIDVERVDQDGNAIFIQVSTGRPQSLLPVTLKLGERNMPENFHVFNTLEELQSFFSAGVEHLLGAYGAGWQKIATFNWQVYIDELGKL